MTRREKPDQKDFGPGGRALQRRLQFLVERGLSPPSTSGDNSKTKRPATRRRTRPRKPSNS